MSDLFSLYEDNLNQVMNQLRIITSTFSTLSRDKAESAITNGASLIKEGEKILRQMELEISSNNTLTGMNALTAKVKNYNNEFQNLKFTFEKIQTNYISKKAENAIFLGTEDNTEHKANQNIELIENEENNNSKDHEEKVEVRDIFDAKGDGHLDETIPDENDLNVKIEKKGRKTIIIATVTIITLLLLAIIVLSIYISKKKDKEEEN